MDPYFIIICILCLIAAAECLRLAIKYIRILKTGIECKAMISKFEEVRAKGGKHYRPLFKFFDTDGNVHFVLSPTGYKKPDGKYKTGQEVTIHYDRNDPEKITFEKTEFIIPIIGLIIALLFPIWSYFKFN